MYFTQFYKMLCTDNSKEGCQEVARLVYSRWHKTSYISCLHHQIALTRLNNIFFLIVKPEEASRFSDLK